MSSLHCSSSKPTGTSLIFLSKIEKKKNVSTFVMSTSLYTIKLPPKTTTVLEGVALPRD